MPARTASDDRLAHVAKVPSRRLNAPVPDAPNITRTARYHRARGGLEAWPSAGALPGVRGPDAAPAARGQPAQARRRDARRQPALGQGRSARDTAHGHRAGAANIEPLLGWCDEVGIEVVTLWLLSTDNLNRPAARARRRCSRSSRSAVDVARRPAPLAAAPGRRARPAARRRPPRSSRPPRRPPATSTGCWSTSRSGTAAAARSPTPSAPCSSEHAAKGTSLEELAEIIDVEHIAEHLYTKGQPDPDLVIRTSGEQRLGGFLLWQSAQVGVLLLRGLLARLPPGRLPARDPRLRPARAPLRRLSRRPVGLDVTCRSPRGRACRTGPAAAGGVRSAASASGEARRIGRPESRDESRSATDAAAALPASHVGAGTPAFGLPPGPSAAEFRTGRGVRAPVREG